jgi:hypothetical protein
MRPERRPRGRDGSGASSPRSPSPDQSWHQSDKSWGSGGNAPVLDTHRLPAHLSPPLMLFHKTFDRTIGCVGLEFALWPSSGSDYTSICLPANPSISCPPRLNFHVHIGMLRLSVAPVVVALVLPRGTLRPACAGRRLVQRRYRNRRQRNLRTSVESQIFASPAMAGASFFVPRRRPQPKQRFHP